MSKNSDSSSNKIENPKKLELIGYSFAIISFLIFLYTFFTPVEKELKQQAIYWFYSSLIAALIPNIEQFKIKDFEVKFKEKLEKIDQKLDLINQDVLIALEAAVQDESKLSDEDKKKRDEAYKKYAKNLKTLPANEQFKQQKQYTLLHLGNRGLSVYDLKQNLRQLNYYKGEINSIFDSELVSAIVAFQEYEKLESDGTCGPITLAKIGERLTKSDRV